MEIDDFASVLANSDFFAMCNDEQKRLLAFASEQKQFAAGEIIYARGDASRGAYVLISGQARAGENGSVGIKAQDIAEPGTLIGELGLIVDRPRRSTVYAYSDIELLFVPRTAFLKLIRQYPDLADKAISRIQGELSGFLSAVSGFSNSP